MGTYSAWESSATLRLLGGARGAWARTGEERRGDILSPRAQLLYAVAPAGMQAKTETEA